MQQNIIDLGFDVESLTAEKKAVLSSLLEVYDVALKINNTKIAPTMDPTWKELKAAVASQSAEIQKLQDANIKYIKTQEALVKSETAVINQITAEEKAMQANIKTRQALTQEQERAEKAQARQAKQAEESANEYLKLVKAYNQAALNAKNLAVQRGLEDEQTKKAITSTKEMLKVLMSVEAAVGQNQRNVGNYKSAFDGLGMSVTQIARELPSLTISVQQFALAISNNLPMFFDEIAKAKVQIAALQAEGQAVPSLMTQIGKSFLSWQVGLSVGIALLTAFSGKIADFVTGLFNSDQALKKNLESQTKMNDAVADGTALLQKNYDEQNKLAAKRIDYTQDQIDQNKALGLSAQDAARIQDELDKKRSVFNTSNLLVGEALADAFQHQNSDLLKKSEILTLSINRISMQLAKLDAPAPARKPGQRGVAPRAGGDREMLEAEKKNLESQLRINEYTYNETQKIIDSFYDNKRKRELAAAEETARINEEVRKNTLDTAVTNANNVIAKNEFVLNFEGSSEKQRLAALKSNFEERKKIIRAERDFVTSDPKNRNKDGTYTAEANAAIRKAQSERFKNELDYQERSREVKEDYRNRNLSAAQAAFEAELSLTQVKNKAILDNELATISQKMDAQRANVQAQIDLEDSQYKLAIQKRGLTDKELESLATVHQQKLTEIEVRAVIDRLKLITDLRLNAEGKAAKNEETDAIQRLTRDYQRNLDNLNAKTISYKQFVAEKERLDRNYADQALLDQLVSLEKTKEILQKGGRDVTAINNQIAAVEKAILDKKIANKEKSAKKEIDIDKQIRDKAIELAFATLDVIQAATTAQYENEKNRIQNLMDLSDERYSREIKNIQASSLADQDKAAKVAVLEADQAAARRKYEAEIREQNIKKAKTDRVFQIFQIAGNTAIGITSALAQFPPNPILAAIIGAIGAAQIAKVLATPIPQYADGTPAGGHPADGPAVVGEGKYKERVKMPGKAAFIADRAMLLNLPKHSTVTPIKGEMTADYMQGGVTRTQSAKMALLESLDVAGGRQAWNVAKWQVAEMKRILRPGKTVVKNNITVNAGWYSYLNSKVYGRSN